MTKKKTPQEKFKPVKQGRRDAGLHRIVRARGSEETGLRKLTDKEIDRLIEQATRVLAAGGVDGGFFIDEDGDVKFEGYWSPEDMMSALVSIKNNMPDRTRTLSDDQMAELCNVFDGWLNRIGGEAHARAARDSGSFRFHIDKMGRISLEVRLVALHELLQLINALDEVWLYGG